MNDNFTLKIKEEKMKKLFLITVILFIPVIVNSCGEEEINSAWKSSPIIIDGKETDWQGKTNYFTDYKAAIGVENDDDYLYLCLAVNDTGKVFQLFNRGFTVWIDPDNGNEKLGILYPIGAVNSGELMPFRNQSQGGRRERPDFGKIFSEMKMKQNEIRIVNGDNFPLTSYDTNDTSVVHVDIGTQMGLLVYELKIPLSKKLRASIILTLNREMNLMLVLNPVISTVIISKAMVFKWETETCLRKAVWKEEKTGCRPAVKNGDKDNTHSRK